MEVKPIIEILEIAAILTILIVSGKKLGKLSQGFGAWCVLGLGIDVLIWKCVRPWYIQDVFNSINVIIGAIIIYEHLKSFLRQLFIVFLSMFR